jgi:alginate O-acetyltransferase complex protein AlgI
MVFSSVTFLFYFLPIFIAAYFSLPCKNFTILLFSLAFYAWGEPRFVPILLVYILGNYAIGRLISQRAGPIWMQLGVAGNLGLLIYFKYANFLSAELGHLFARLGLGSLPEPHIVLPLGISFIAFQGISYVVDVHRGVVASQRSLLSFAMYKSMFPQLIAGPIVRYSDIAGEIDRRPVRLDDLAAGTRQFILGLGQKVLISNILAGPADQIFGLPTADRGPATAWLAIACYTLQIFFDFAGYSNMAIGLGRIMGFRYPINFDRPYAAESITAFWRRWHMTLSSWFRDYLYIPLGGSRGSAPRTYANLMLVFLLCGLWHGAAWNFLVWGAWHGLFLVVERLGLGALLARLWRPLRHVYVLLVVAIGWVFFRADTLRAAQRFLGSMAGRGGSGLAPVERFLSTEVWLALAFGAVLATVPATRMLTAAGRSLPAGLASAVTHATLLLILALCLLQVASGAYNPFIYYRF